MVPLRANLPAFEDIKLNDRDQARIKRFKEFNDTGSGYAIEHGTRPSTIGFALAASPIALAAWVGEKLHEWTDETPRMEVVLQWLTLYWLTQTFPTSIYPYRHTMHEQKDPTTRPGESAKDFTKPMTGTYVDKPMGYSLFEYELLPTPISWAKKTGNLVSFAEHEYGESAGLFYHVPLTYGIFAGGHFAATEHPDLLAKDVVEFLNVAWPARKRD
jgi:microsomal epoxide hydrolase